MGRYLLHIVIFQPVGPALHRRVSPNARPLGREAEVCIFISDDIMLILLLKQN